MAEQVLSPQISSSYGWSWFIFFTLGFLRLVMPLAISANALSNRTGRGGEGKTEVPGEKLSEQGREPATNSTHI